MKSDEEEIALALLLWKFLRSHYVLSTSGTRSHATDESPFKVLDLAKKCGVSREFFKLLMKFPVTKITIREYEEWISNDTERQLRRTAKVEYKPHTTARKRKYTSKEQGKGSRPQSPPGI